MLKNIKLYAAELLGTFGLALAVTLSLSGTFPVPTPVIAGLTLGLFVYTIGHISGTHINPAVTVGAWSIGKINTQDAIWYIVSQFLGAGLALYLSRGWVTPASLSLVNSFSVLFGELLGTFFFTFGIASVIYKKTPALLSGVVIGGSLLLGISIAASLSNGVLNPAVALAIGSLSLSYLIGPLLGAILGMWAFRWLAGEIYQ